MKKNNSKYFYFVLVGFVFIVFFLNYYHINQQGTYENIFKPIANNIIAGNGYTCKFFHNEILFYPIWGYSFLVTIDTFFGLSNFFILGIQFLLSILSIITFYKIIKINKKYWHIPLFLPFIALMSVKWPDAIVASILVYFIYLLILYFENKKFKFLFLAGITIGILVNFRSEYLYLPLSLILLLFARSLKEKKFLIFKTIIVLILFEILFLLPWAIRAYNQTGEFRFTASNGGAVIYISLGQLSNNPWNIAPYDKTAYDFAKSKAYINPYSPKADRLFKQKFIQSVEQHPIAFLKKISHNFLSVFYKGVYTGEYANYFIGISRRNEIDSSITSKKGLFNKLYYITKLKPNESCSFIFEKLIQAVFMLILFFMFVIIIFSIWKKIYKNYLYLFWIILPLILYKFLIVSFIQYEYRHINAIYLFVFALCLMAIENIKSIRQ